MPPIINISEAKDYVGQIVTVRGWIKRRTGKGKLNFLRVRDGSGIFQAVAFRPTLGDDKFAQVKKLTTESSVILTGEIRADARAPGVPGGYEMDLRDIEIVQLAEPYPIAPKEHGVEFLLDHRHLWLRSDRQWAIQRVRATVIRAIRDWLDDHGFLNVDTPILTPAAGEGTTTLFEIDYHGQPAYLAQTGQLYNEATAAAYGKVYCFGPTFRAEKSKTRRHLTEFWMVEPEMAFATLDDVMDLAEEFLDYIVTRCLETCAGELEKVLERDVSRLEKVKRPFVRMHYDEAVKLLRNNGVDFEWGNDFGGGDETIISESSDKPVLVHRYPTVVKAFYMQPDPDDAKYSLSVDLLAPEGYGELIGGGERIHDLELLERRIEEHDLPRRAFEWYLDLRRYGSVPHAGFGLGLERTVSYICGLKHLREAIPFPRLLNRLSP